MTAAAPPVRPNGRPVGDALVAVPPARMGPPLALRVRPAQPVAPVHDMRPAAETNANRILRDIVFMLFVVAILLRIAIAPATLNAVVSYTSEGGPLYEKIHPGTYLIVVAFTLSLLGLRTPLTVPEGKACRLLIWLFAVIVLCATGVSLFGHAVSIGYLLDSYVCGCMAGYVVLSLSLEQRRMVVSAVLVVLMANSALTAVEYVMGRGVFLPGYNDGTFRPSGILDHPLTLGGMNVAAIVYVFLTRWSPPAKAVGVGLLLIGIFAAGARTATLVGAVAFLASVILAPQPGVPSDRKLQLRILVVLACMVVVPVTFLAMDAAGLLTRFKDGILDQSGQARVDIYRVFEFVTWDDILRGADIREIVKITTSRLNLPFIESVIVVFIFQFGLPIAVIFLGGVIGILLRLAWGGDIRLLVAVGAYLAVSLSNNALATKDFSLSLTILMVLALRFDRDPPGRPSHAVTS
jgi:hypothetical protein